MPDSLNDEEFFSRILIIVRNGWHLANEINAEGFLWRNFKTFCYDLPKEAEIVVLFNFLEFLSREEHENIRSSKLNIYYSHFETIVKMLSHIDQKIKLIPNVIIQYRPSRTDQDKRICEEIETFARIDVDHEEMYTRFYERWKEYYTDQYFHYEKIRKNILENRLNRDLLLKKQLFWIKLSVLLRLMHLNYWVAKIKKLILKKKI